MTDDLDWKAFVDELYDRWDEIEGTIIKLPGGGEMWIHSQYQVRKWLLYALNDFISGGYLTD